MSFAIVYLMSREEFAVIVVKGLVIIILLS